MIPIRPQRAGAAYTRAGAVAAVVLAVAAAQEPALAQTLRGRVVDSEVGHPVGGATVRIKGGPPPLTTDSLGRFEAANLPAGEAQLTIEGLGYATAEFKVELPASGAVFRSFSLDFTGYRLPEFLVEGRAAELAPRYADFELRRRRKLGTYLRWDELNKGSYSSVGDALRTVRGVRIRCDQRQFECRAVMARSPQCEPTWFIDGVEVRSFHENTSIRDVYGIEVYRGAGEVPGEFAGSNAACGVIVMWTKSRPYRE